MRYISANASGRTGAWLAEKMKNMTDVHSLCSPEASLRMPDTVSTEVFSTTHDLMGRMENWIKLHPNGVTIHSAAVGDYAVDGHNADIKISSGQPSVSVHLTPTPKILDEIHQWSSQGHIVSFKAAAPETEMAELEQMARRQGIRSHSAMVFANIIGDTEGSVMLVDEHGFMPFTTRKEGLIVFLERLMALCAS
jgi:phosphopantothenoylcysteine synthetase/decarboxylase